ncbi:flagellar basal body-associated protein FliL [Pseudoroseicyclus sp. CXY001]|uniref:flagellar basal body-associated FliL family protein n=1 Tax=Pseudoroseicyclus sp. CXY001 TaxID=3242492 RepID=UPI0035713566
MSDATASEAEAAEEAPPKKKSKLPLILGLVLAIAGGAGGFFAVRMGLIGGSHDEAATGAEAESLADLPVLAPAVFLPMEPIVVNLPADSGHQHLRFSAQLEVVPGREREVTDVMPRITDVLNTYLRAVDLAALAESNALTTLRAQLLRRVQVITGEGRVRDLLIMEFVLD